METKTQDIGRQIQRKNSSKKLNPGNEVVNRELNIQIDVKDSIKNLGKYPIILDLSDASVEHNKYIY